MTEIVMDAYMETDVKEEGGFYYVYVMDQRVGHGVATREVAEALQRWITSGLQDMMEVLSKAIDQAFAETGK